MKFLQADLELIDHLPNYGENQVRTDADKQTRESPPSRSSCSSENLVVPQIEQIGSKSRGPLSHTVDGFSRQQHIAHP